LCPNRLTCILLNTACMAVDREVIIKALDLAKRMRTILEEKKAGDIVILDVRKQTDLADYFVIATGTSNPHLKAMNEQLIVDLKHDGIPCYRHAGAPEGGWLAIDYVDVLVHLFLESQRAYYALEDLWTGATKVK